ncbi:CAMPATH-1 antigen [Carlito syrichta]|uniref:CAMPATH-1 antigen n=1 Tax=Carlito syrichta TaxID=1868482 RepID=A0A3Q0DPP7_CARSF|nr:CAMPATH-1 antigen [Carlito syrichta]
MKDFLFLLLTISLLVVTQIQTRVLGNHTMANSVVPVFSDVSGGSFLFFLINTFIHLFHLS